MDENQTPNNSGEELDVLYDEDGKETRFEHLGSIELDNEEYVVLLPAEETEEAGEVVILKVEDTDSEDEKSYVSVEDEDVLNRVFDIFKDKFKDEFDFVD